MIIVKRNRQRSPRFDQKQCFPLNSYGATDYYRRTNLKKKTETTAIESKISERAAFYLNSNEIKSSPRVICNRYWENIHLLNEYRALDGIIRSVFWFFFLSVNLIHPCTHFKTANGVIFLIQIESLRTSQRSIGALN